MAMNKKKAVILTVVIVAAAAVLLYFLMIRKGSQDDGTGTAYVQSVSTVMDTGMVGMVNQYAGIVESQETWSVSKNSDARVSEVKVKAGDTVKKGDVLFTYDTSGYQSQLDQANIDMQRLNNDLKTLNDTLASLQKQQKSAKASEQAQYTLQIQEQQLSIQQKQLDIQSKQEDIDKLNDNISNNSVVSEIDGVVKSINDGTTVSSSGESTDAFITVMKTGDLRVKGTVSEQNIGSLTEGMAVTIRSRVDSDKTWKGKISKIDTENAQSQQSMYVISSDNSATGTKYPFYVELESSDGLMMGQHVYIEPDMGENETVDKSEGIWIGSYYTDQSDAAHPFVWADNGHGRIEKREVTLGKTDDLTGEVQITSGLSADDSIAIPDGIISEGMKTAPISEMPADYGQEGGEVLSDSGTGAVFSESVSGMKADDGMTGSAESGTADGAAVE
ncbi:MAG: biotin/lipoyl-binding protein [Eubacteriales bacterium]|jgi:HlyD family secretion protein